MNRYVIVLACALLALAGLVQAQTTSLTVTIGPEAVLSVSAALTPLATTSTTFGSPFTGTTTMNYQIRTSKSGELVPSRSRLLPTSAGLADHRWVRRRRQAMRCRIPAW